MTASPGAIAEIVESDSDRLIDFYRDLVRIPSVWGDAERLTEAAELLSDELASSRFSIELADSGTEGMPMVIARLPGRGPGRSLIFNGHMEVYPPSESWSLDPFAGEIRDGRLFGQGAADMKAGTAAMTMACSLLGRHGVELEGDVILLAVPNHFEGGEGTRKALRDGLSADFAINCEPSGLAVLTGQRGILYLTITTTGRAAHTTALSIGVNAIDRAARVVSALGRMVFCDSDGRPLVAEKMMNVAMIGGGITHNIVPESCRLTVDVRFTPEQTQDDVVRDVRAAVTSALDKDEFPTTVEIEPTCLRNPRSSLRLPPDHPLVLELASAHQAFTHEAARLEIHPAWPDTPIFNEMGVPAVTYGPGSMDCYWDDESVAIDEYLTAIKTYCLAACSITAF